jgi:hypothetical protein
MLGIEERGLEGKVGFRTLDKEGGHSISGWKGNEIYSSSIFFTNWFEFS